VLEKSYVTLGDPITITFFRFLVL